MLNIIQNTIGAIRRVGESVVRAGLKMWLPFTKAEHLGVNVVTDGSFNDTSEWIKENGWVVSGGLATRTDVDSFTALQQNCLVSGKTYIVTIVVDSITSGDIFGIRLGTNYILQGGLSVGTHTATGTANSNLLSIMGNTDFAGTISSITIQEYAQETPDISGNDNNAILKTGKALVFANNDSVQTSFPTSKDIKTIAFWIYPTHSNTAETLFYFGGSSFGTRFLQLNHLTLISDSFNNTNFNVHIDGVDRGETNVGGDNPTLVINEWQRVVLTSSTSFNTTTNTFDIASKGFGSDGRFKMSDLQVYGAEFTTDDIAYDYANPQKLVTDNASSSVTLNDLHAWWHMSEGDGTIAFDSAPLIGKELVTNGDFYTNSDWVTESGWNIENGKATKSGATSSALIQNISLPNARVFQLTFEVSGKTNGYLKGEIFGGGGSDVFFNNQIENGSHSFTTTSTVNRTQFQFYAYGGFNGSIDNVSIKEVFNIDGETYHASSLGATYDDAQERIPQLGMMNWSKGSNLIEYSEDFSSSYWSNGSVTLESGYLAPDGTLSAYKLTADESFSNLKRVFTNIASHSRSIWAKTTSGTGTVALLSRFDSTGSIVTVTNEWQRFEINTANGGFPNEYHVVDFRGGNLDEVILWGAQLESDDGSVSAYRRTNGTAVTDATLISCATDSQKDILGNAVRVKGSGFNLDGTGLGEVPHTTDFDFGTGDFSVSAWVKYGFVDKGSGLNVIFSNGLASASGSNNGFHLFSQADGIYFRMSNGTILETKNIISNPTTNNWYHIAITRSGTDLNTYIDNVGTSHTISSIDVDTSFPLKIGVDRRSDRHYSYKIDDVILYDTELSSDEIEQNYKATKSGHNN